MIPKIIHYCWFGRGQKTALVAKCISSWNRWCPDYEIIEWNEDNFDVLSNQYTEFCYNNKCYAYLSDYVRLFVVEKIGGIYLDTDVELIKSPDGFLGFDAFLGFESPNYINTGLGFGAVAHNPLIQTMLEEYNQRPDCDYIKDFAINHKMTGSPTMNTNALTKLGLIRNGKTQFIDNAIILSKDFLCPFNDLTGDLAITSDTISIHWYGKSAQGKYARYYAKFSRLFHRLTTNKKKDDNKQ